MTMRILTVVAVIFCLAFSSPAEEFPLKYQLTKDSTFGAAPRMAARPVATADNKASQMKGVPSDISNGAFFATTQLRDGLTYTILLDPARVPVMYIDANRNGDFSDDPKVTGAILSNRPGMRTGASAAVFGPASLPLPDGAGELKIMVEVYAKGDAIAYPAGLMFGDITVNGHKFPAAIVDADYDGRYVSALPSQTGVDLFAIDSNRSGRLDESLSECFPLSRLIQLDAAYYSIAVAPDGAKITVEKADPKLGTLEASTPGARLTLISDNGYFALGGYAGKWQLPVGDYLVLGSSLNASDKTGNWAITGTGFRANRPQFAIRDAQVTSMPVGAPLKPEIDVQGSGGTVSIGLNGLSGQAGDSYSALVTRNGAPIPPRVKILDEAGKVLSSGAFEYG